MWLFYSTTCISFNTIDRLFIWSILFIITGRERNDPITISSSKRTPGDIGTSDRARGWPNHPKHPWTQLTSFSCHFVNLSKLYDNTLYSSANILPPEEGTIQIHIMRVWWTTVMEFVHLFKAKAYLIYSQIQWTSIWK